MSISSPVPVFRFPKFAWFWYESVCQNVLAEPSIALASSGASSLSEPRMLNVVSDTGLSTVLAAGADAEVDGVAPPADAGPDLRKPSTHTSTATTASTSTMTVVISARLGPRFPPWYPYPAAGNWL